MAILRTTWPLLLAAALLISTNGMQATALAMRGTGEGFAGLVIALLISVYYVGFIAGCRFAPGIIQRAGHIRAFAAFASVASASALAHAVVVNEALWLVFRLVSGFSFAAVQMIVESWLNEASTNETRGKTLSIYRVTDFSTVTLTQGLVTLFDPMNFVLFAVISISFSLSLVPVALTKSQQPPVPTSARLDIGAVWRVSPLAVAGALGVGLVTSAYWAMSTIYIQALGYPSTATGFLIGAVIFGGALAQWPVGWLSDKIDRRRVLIGTAGVAVAGAIALPLLATISFSMLIAGGFFFGMVALPIFGLAVAHANDHAAPGTTVSVNGSLLMLHAVAAVIGPLAAAGMMAVFGASALFAWIASVLAGLFAFGLYRMTRRGAVKPREDYVAVPRTSPAVFDLDPRAPAQEEDDDTATPPQDG